MLEFVLLLGRGIGPPPTEAEQAKITEWMKKKREAAIAARRRDAVVEEALARTPDVIRLKALREQLQSLRATGCKPGNPDYDNLTAEHRALHRKLVGPTPPPGTDQATMSAFAQNAIRIARAAGHLPTWLPGMRIPNPRPSGYRYLDEEPTNPDLKPMARPFLQGPPFYARHTPRGFSTPTVHAFASAAERDTWVLQHKDPTIWIGITPQVAAAMLARGVALVTHVAGDEGDEQVS